jgi:hypothetical protein
VIDRLTMKIPATITIHVTRPTAIVFKSAAIPVKAVEVMSGVYSI